MFVGLTDYFAGDFAAATEPLEQTRLSRSPTSSP